MLFTSCSLSYSPPPQNGTLSRSEQLTLSINLNTRIRRLSRNLYNDISRLERSVLERAAPVQGAANVKKRRLLTLVGRGRRACVLPASSEAHRLPPGRSRLCAWVFPACCRRAGSHDGSSTVKVLPSPSALVTPMVPRCCMTMCFTMLSPSPVPPISLERFLSTL